MIVTFLFSLSISFIKFSFVKSNTRPNLGLNVILKINKKKFDKYNFKLKFTNLKRSFAFRLAFVLNTVEKTHPKSNQKVKDLL